MPVWPFGTKRIESMESEAPLLLYPVEIDSNEFSVMAEIAAKLRRSPVRPLLESVLKREPIALSDLSTLAGAFYKSVWWTWREPMAAAWILGKLNLGDEVRDWVIEQLVAVLDQQTHVRTPKAAWNYACCWFAFSNGIFFWALPLLLVVENRSDRVRAAAARALGEQRSAFALTSLLMAATDGEETVRGNCTRGVRRAAREALRQVVDALPADCYGEMPDQIVSRCIELLRKPDEALSETMLIALEKFAGGNALKPVQQMAQRGRTPRLRALSDMVIPVLERRSVLERAKESLLRAASAPVDASKLLRPAGSGQREEEDKLLRPASAEASHDQEAEGHNAIRLE